MALNTTTSTVSYAGNNTSTRFAIPFPYWEVDEILVFRDDAQLVRNVDYTLTQPGQTGEVVLSRPLLSGTTLKIYRLLPFLQKVVFQIQGQFNPKAIEEGLDRVVAMLQQLNDGLITNQFHGDQPGGSLHAPVTLEKNGFATPELLGKALGSAPIDSPIFIGDPPAWHDPLQIEPIPVLLEGSEISWEKIKDTPDTLEDYGIVDAAPIDSPEFTGEPYLPGGTRLGNTNLGSFIDSKAPRDNPIFVGTVGLPAETYLDGVSLSDSLAALSEEKAPIFSPVFEGEPFLPADTWLAGVHLLSSLGNLVNEMATKANIADIYLRAEADSRFKLSSWLPAWVDVRDKPNTLAGFGITNGLTTSAFNAFTANDFTPRISAVERRMVVVYEFDGSAYYVADFSGQNSDMAYNWPDAIVPQLNGEILYEWDPGHTHAPLIVLPANGYMYGDPTQILVASAEKIDTYSHILRYLSPNLGDFYNPQQLVVALEFEGQP